MLCFIFKQKTAYEMRISDWSSDLCSSDLKVALLLVNASQQLTGDALGMVRPDIIQFHGSETPEWLAVVKRLAPADIWKAVGQIGRASCRERVCQYESITVVAVALKKKKPT